MPITRRQFELGINPAIEEWMEKAYDFLEEHKDQAYSERELILHFGADSDATTRNQISSALQALVRVRAIDVRYVGNETYYAFVKPVRKSTWEIDESPF